MDKIEQIGQSQGLVFSSNSDYYATKYPSLKLKTHPQTTFRFSPVIYLIRVLDNFKKSGLAIKIVKRYRPAFGENLFRIFEEETDDTKVGHDVGSGNVLAKIKTIQTF
jgi:hypothetical protein